MQKRDIKITQIMRPVLNIVLISMVTVSCNKHIPVKEIIGKTVLEYDSLCSKLTDERFKYDSLFIERMSYDSMIINRYLGRNGYYCSSSFSLRENIFYENRVVPQLIIEGETETSIVLIATFLKGDTIFNYFPEDDFFSVFVNDLSFNKCKYQIKKGNNEFITIKQSLIDTTYSEIYYYDQYFNIYKFINTWKDNECVYVKK
jgi:hypothetical protein